jgi:hypothetical protein
VAICATQIIIKTHASMNKIIVFLKSTPGKTILIVLLLVVSFYGGMEYKAYQIRSAMKEVFSGISDVFGGKTETSKDGEKPKISNDLTKKVGFEIMKKGFSSANYSSSITFTFQFTNNTDKDIEGVEGLVTFNDIFGNTIKEVNLSYDKGLKAGEIKLYSPVIDYNQFMDSDTKLKNTELSKLKYEWQINKIVYTDGSIETN